MSAQTNKLYLFKLKTIKSKIKWNYYYYKLFINVMHLQYVRCIIKTVCA